MKNLCKLTGGQTNRLCRLAIIAFTALIGFSLVACGDGAGGANLGGVVSKPPASPGPDGVWVDGDGNLRINSVPVYIMDNSTPPKVVLSDIGFNRLTKVSSWVGMTEVDWASTGGGVVNGFLNSITIYPPPPAALTTPTNWDEMQIPASFIVSGATTRAAYFHIRLAEDVEPPNYNRFLELMYAPYVVKETSSEGYDYYRAYGQKNYWYFYSEGEIVISGSGTYDMDGMTISGAVDIKFTTGWNVLCITQEGSGKNWSYNMVSESPTGNVQWVQPEPNW